MTDKKNEVTLVSETSKEVSHNGKELSIQEKLVKIQQTLKAPKNQRNTFGNYNYRSCEDILEAVKPLLNGCVLLISDEIINLGDRFYVKTTAEINDGKQLISCSAYAREAAEKKGMDVAQITGATSSYARKYALNGLFAIDDTKDADTTDNTDRTPKKAQSDLEWINNPQEGQISEYSNKCKICGAVGRFHKPSCPVA